MFPHWSRNTKFNQVRETAADKAFFANLEKQANAWKEEHGAALDLPERVDDAHEIQSLIPVGHHVDVLTDDTVTTKKLDPNSVAEALGATQAGSAPQRRP